MQKNYIKYRSVQVSLPEAAYDSAKILAQQENRTVSKYIVALVEREIHKKRVAAVFC